MNSQLPQHSEDAFRRFERDIAAIVQNYPNASVIDPAPLSPTTYACRIRDAINAAVSYSYPSHLFNDTDLRSIFKCLRSGGRFIFTPCEGGRVLCTDRSLSLSAGIVNTLSPVTVAIPGELDARDTDLLTAILTLKNRMLHVEPLVVVNLDSPTANRINEHYPNVDLTPIDDLRSLMT